MNRRLIILLGLAQLFYTTGCVSPYLTTGQAYHQRGNLPVAIEYFDSGLIDEPANEEMRDALIVAEQTYQWQLRDEIDRLKEGGSYLLAVSKLYELLERAHRMTAIQLPTELPTDIEGELRGLTRKATEQLAADLDQRAGRSQILVSDLQACRQIQALEIEDDYINRRCEQLLNQLKLVASGVVASDSHPLGNQILQAIQKNVMAQNPELIGFTNPNSTTRNAQLVVKVGPYYQRDTGWYLKERDAYHVWVEKLDKRGRPIKRKVTTPPDPKKVEKAKKEGKEPPKAKTEYKQVWVQVQGDYRFYESARKVYFPFQVTLVDLRDNTQVVAFEGLSQSESISRYYDYEGHHRARKNISGRGQQGKHTARPVANVGNLVQQAANKIPGHVSKAILKRIE